MSYVMYLPWTGLDCILTGYDYGLDCITSLVMDYYQVALYHMYDNDSFLGSL